MELRYPLSALAYQDELQLALSLIAVSPDIGGLLIRGDRGAAKSTAARGLADLLPRGGPFVNLPLGATKDRVVGTLDVEAALRGEARLLPGLMAQADGGILYIDEVNLLPDHLVDLLLDAAAQGVARVQRDKLSAEMPARFALIGSMNPEEGSLRPQFLDRFGLCVDVLSPLEPTQRAEIVRRRVAFERDRAQFLQRYQPQQEALHARLSAARQLLPGVFFPDEWLSELAKLSAQAGVRSLRADLVIYRAARALSAFAGRSEVRWDDVERVAPLALRHRRDPTAPPNPPSPQPSSDRSEQPPPAEGEEVFAPSEEALALQLPNRSGRGRQGEGRPAQVIRTVHDPSPNTLHMPATLRAAARRGGTIERQDLQRPVYAPQGGRQLLFAVDSSGSLGLSGRMGAVKALLLRALSEGQSADKWRC